MQIKPDEINRAIEMNFRHEAQIQQPFGIEKAYALQNCVISGAFQIEPPFQFTMDTGQNPAAEIVIDVIPN